ncbi:hypothetical protein KCU87_g474, partial [Aureobasidium melanogenum]
MSFASLQLGQQSGRLGKEWHLHILLVVVDALSVCCHSLSSRLVAVSPPSFMSISVIRDILLFRFFSFLPSNLPPNASADESIVALLLIFVHDHIELGQSCTATYRRTDGP